MIPIKTIPLVTGRAEEWANGCEQYAVHLTYDLKPLLEKWPYAVPSVAFERADGEKYPHAWEQEEDVLHIPLTKADTAIAGLCKCVVTVTSGDGQHNSDVFHGRVSQGLDTLGEEPDEPMQGIIEQVNGAAVRAESAATNAADDAQAAQTDAETANAAALAAGEQAQNAASAAVRSESGAVRAEKAAERAENAEVPPEMIADMIEKYLEENPPEAPVQSVNGQTGEVELTAKDVGALPENTEIPKPYTLPVATADVMGGVKVGNGLIVLEDGTLSANADSVGALPKSYEAPVLSVNGETGEIELTAEDVGAAPAIEDTTYKGCYYRMVDGEKEWFNPPMVLGVEYRTTERFAELVVYKKYISGGWLGNGAQTIEHGIGITHPMEAQVFNHESENLTNDESTVGLYFSRATVVYNSTTAHGNVTFSLKYTKS